MPQSDRVEALQVLPGTLRERLMHLVGQPVVVYLMGVHAHIAACPDIRVDIRVGRRLQGLGVGRPGARLHPVLLQGRTTRWAQGRWPESWFMRESITWQWEWAQMLQPGMSSFHTMPWG